MPFASNEKLLGLGLFLFVINVLMLYVTDWIVPGFEIDGFWWGAAAAVIVSLVNGLLNPLLRQPDEETPKRRR